MQNKTTKAEDTKSSMVTGKRDRHGKSRKPFRKPDDGSKPYIGPNDIKWRTSNLLSKLASTLPFGYPAGIPWKGVFSAPVKTSGIMAIQLIVTAGTASDYNSGLNLATRKSYSFIRHANSGSKNYEAADLGLYYVSVGQAIALLGWLQRMYRTITAFSSTNRYTPATLITIQGVDYDDLKAHQAEFAWLIRWLGNAVNSLNFPKMSYFEACYYTFSKYFEDNTSPKQQVYLLTPRTFGRYNPTHSNTGGGVEYYKAQFKSGGNIVQLSPNAGVTFNELFSYTHSIMDVLLSDEDIGIMSGDILKAYGEGGLFKCASESDTPITFEHSVEFLQQVHNCEVLNDKLAKFDGYSQNPGATNTAPYLVQDVTLNNLSFGQNQEDEIKLSGYIMIDAFSEAPDDKEVVNCCVLKANATLEMAQVDTVAVVDPAYIYFDLYIPTGIAVSYSTDNNDVFSTDTYASFSPMSYLALNHPLAMSDVDMDYVSFLNNFDWHPMLMSHSSGRNTVSVIGDVQNANFFPAIVIERIHDSAILSLFNFSE